MQVNSVSPKVPFNWKAFNRKMLPYYFLSPVLIIIAGFILYPILNVFYYSFWHYNPNMPYKNGFAGFDNYIRIFTGEPIFYSTLLISAQYIFTEVALQLVLGMAIALVLNQQFKGRGVVRGVIFAPWALSGVIVAIMWSMIFNENMGVLNDLLLRWGLIQKPVAWVSMPATALPAVIIAELWRGVPFFAVSLLASLQSIPNELYESCSIDGGGKLDRFFYIVLPYLKDTIVLTTLLRLVWEFNSVDLIMNLTGGGPMNLTSTLSIYLADQAIKTRNFGYGSAVGVVSFMIMLVFALIYLKASKFGEAK